MYEQVFNFNSRPFTTTPYARHYFAASSMHQAIGQASICVERGSGPVVAIGDIGVGKSLFLEMLQVHFQHKFVVVTITCSRDSTRREFLQNILFQLGRPTDAGGDAEMRFSIVEAAAPSESCPNGILLLVDDAEVLNSEIFDELRLLMNFVVEGVPRIRAVLAGRKSLEDRLAQPEIASFSQRIASRVFLQNLSREETNQYIVEHINRVGGAGASMFPPETNAKVHELTDGCPRQINQVSDFVLILAGTRGLQSVRPQLIEEAWADLQSLPGGDAFTTEAVATDAPSDWTVIEFGELDDDGATGQAAASDFHASELPAVSAVEGSDPMMSPVAAGGEFDSQAENVVADQGRQEVVSDLGIDLAALQAMRDTHASKVREANAVAEAAAPDAGVYQHIVETDSAEPVAENPAPVDSGNSMTEIQAQLAAVFGSMASENDSTPVQPESETQVQESAVQPESFDTGRPEAPATPFQSNAGFVAEPKVEASVEQSHAGFEAFREQVVPANAAGDDFVPASAALGQSNVDSVVSNEPAGNASIDSATNVHNGDDPLAAFQASLAQLRSGDPEAWASTPAENTTAEDAVSQATESRDLAQGFEAPRSVEAPVQNQEFIEPPAFESKPVETGERRGDSLPFETPPAFGQDAALAEPSAERKFEAERFAATEFSAAPLEQPVQSAAEMVNVASPKTDDASGNSNSHFDDPFAESFEEVESVSDRFAPEIAVHNQNALDITSADLQHVQPLPEQQSPANIAETTKPCTESSMQSRSVAEPPIDAVQHEIEAATGSRETAQYPEATHPPEAAQPQFAAEETPRYSSPSGVNWIKEILPSASEETEEVEPGHPVQEPAATIVELPDRRISLAVVECFAADLPAGSPDETTRQETVDEELTARLKANTPLRGFTISPPSDAQTAPAVEPSVGAPNNSQAQPTFGSENEPAATIQTQQSPTTQTAEPSTQPAAAVENAAGAKLAFVQPTYEWKQPTLSAPTEPTAVQALPVTEAPVSEPARDQLEPSQVSAAEAQQLLEHRAKEFREEHKDEAASEEISRQADEILKRLERANSLDEQIKTASGIDDQDSGVQILDEIRKQQQMVAGMQQGREPSMMAGHESGSPSSTDEFQTPGTLPMVPRNEHSDDSEMLVVKKASETPTPAEEPRNENKIPHLDEQVSQGRAQRMNYQELFDRLRDMPENE